MIKGAINDEYIKISPKTESINFNLLKIKNNEIIITIGGSILVNRKNCCEKFLTGNFSLAKAYPANVPIIKHRIVTPLETIILFSTPLLNKTAWLSFEVKILMYLSNIGFLGIKCTGTDNNSAFVEILEIIIHKKGAKVKNKTIAIKKYNVILFIINLVRLFII